MKIKLHDVILSTAKDSAKGLGSAMKALTTLADFKSTQRAQSTRANACVYLRNDITRCVAPAARAKQLASVFSATPRETYIAMIAKKSLTPIYDEEESGGRP